MIFGSKIGYGDDDRVATQIAATRERPAHQIQLLPIPTSPLAIGVVSSSRLTEILHRLHQLLDRWEFGLQVITSNVR